MTWDETSRRLDDGTYVRISDVPEMPDWLHVSIMAPGGQQMFTGTMTKVQAFLEIPFQLDRARAFERAYGALRNFPLDDETRANRCRFHP